jgi:nitrous oxidase accessory protein NosD
MKFSAAFVGLVGLAVASPYTEHDTSNGLIARGVKCDIPRKYMNYPSTPKLKKYYGHGRTIHVKPGQKIQQAIKKASPGDRIVVAGGEYSEQLVIDKDGIRLEGHGATLKSPDPKYLKKNACTGLTQDPQKNELQAGICITGYKVKTDDFVTEHKIVTSVGRPVKGVSVTGFTVQGFSGINIAILGAKNTYITNNKLVDGGAYGALTLGSINTVFYDNVVTTTKGGFIAICMDNKSDVFTKKNDISNHLIGLCVQTNGAVMEYNKLTNNCFGVFVDPGVREAKIAHNYIGPTPAACDKNSAGIILGSSIGVLVTDNTIEGQKASDGSGAGVRIYDDPCIATPEMPISLSCVVLGKAIKARDNVVVRNTLNNNDNDIQNLSKGSGNIIKCNTCKNEANIKAGQCKKP